MRRLLLSLIVASALSVAQARGQEIHTTLEHVLVEGGSAVWEVTVRAQDIGEPAPVVHLQDWGEWTDYDGYLELVESDPPLVGEGPEWRVDPDADWDERLLARFRLHPTDLGSPEQRAHGLLPTTGPSYTFGYSWNVIPNLLRGGSPIEAERTLALRAPAEVMITSGWVGHGRGHQHFDLDANQGNAMVAFGEWTSMDDSGLVEVYQFGGTFPIAEQVHALIEKLLPTMEEGCAHPAAKPQRVFVVDNKAGGTGTDFGLRIGFTAGMDEGTFESPYFLQLVAHELFHHWLG
ncbi:MAG: hypothetical protein O2816_19825, partial [Planctomycetota bacterium]|nr:hypothetical protein [Planctomycetota bacterium]